MRVVAPSRYYTHTRAHTARPAEAVAISGLYTPYVDRALKFFGIDRSEASDDERCEQLLEVLERRGIDLPSFVAATMPVAPSPAGGTTDRRAAEGGDKRYEELSHQGYVELQALQPYGCDTLTDLDCSAIDSVRALYEAVIGKAMRQESVVVNVDVGPMTLAGLPGQAWNDRIKGVRFNHHDEVWQVRSHPRGRIGKKLVPGEVRNVTVLIRSSQRHDTVGQLATVRLQLLPPAAAATRPEVQRAQSTYGAIGVPSRGIHLWPDHGADVLAARGFPEGKGGFHAVYGGYALLMHTPKEGPHANSSIPCSMTSDFVHLFVLAAHLAGFSIPDRPAHRNGISAVEHRAFAREKHTENVRFCNEIHEAYPDREPSTFAARLIWGAADVAERASLLGLLDALADPAQEYSLPDDLQRPNGLMLLLAVAVRIACNPEAFDVQVPTPDDVWATRGVCQLLESAHPYVFTDDDAPAERGGQARRGAFATDLFLEHTIAALKADLDVHENENAVDSEVVDVVRTTVRNSLETLNCLGIAVCVDVCGAVPKQRDGTSGVYNEFGLARGCCDPVQEARHQGAYDAGLGNLAPWTPPTRTSTRGARQSALVRVFGLVERWLVDGTHHGITLPPRSKNLSEVHQGVTELCVEKTFDEAGNVSHVSIKREVMPPGVAEAAEAIRNGAPAAEATAVSAAESAAAGGGKSGNKKKQRAAAKRGARALSSISIKTSGGPRSKRDDAALDRIALETMARSTGTALSETEALDKVSAVATNRRRERARTRRSKFRQEALHTPSVMEGGELLSNILQQGVCRGATGVFDVETFVGGLTSKIRCAHCERYVNLVEGLAFAGQFGRCQSCRHPRCLHCVDEDIDAINRNADDERASANAEPVYGRDVHGCLFCLRG